MNSTLFDTIAMRLPGCLRRLQRQRSHAQLYLEQLQSANEAYQGLYAERVAEAEAELAQVDLKIRRWHEIRQLPTDKLKPTESPRYDPPVSRPA